jgi:co-chaperonin GroES (HSP10)
MTTVETVENNGRYQSSLAASPTGYRLLIRLAGKAAKTAGGIYVPDENRDRDHAASIVAEVIAMGEEAYLDKLKFPSGPWCQVGDWVMFRRYAGVRFRVKGDDREYRILNDDSVDAVVADPAAVESV